MKIYKSDVYTTIALILLVVCFTFPAIAFYKVPQKIAAGQIDSIPSYVYPLWNLYQKGRYVSPYTPKGAEGDLKKMIEKKGEVGMMSFPVWYVALEAPNYPKAAFPEGIPVWFHVDGFSGDIHEMNTINHYVGMYPLEDGAKIERALGPFLMLGISLLMILFICIRKKWSWIFMLPSALFPLGFFAFYSGWMYWFGHNMQEWGAFKIKAFMPTALGFGHVAHFTTKSFPSASNAAGELQKAIDDASEFATVKLGPGLYEGNIVIRKPLTLVATQPSAVIKGDGKGSVVTVESSYVTIEGLEIINSGGEHQTIDSGIAVKNGFNVKIKNNKIHECLFGVNLEKSNNCVVEDNQISSKKLSLGLRGDGIRLWYSHSNLIIKNHTFQVRDNVFWYSSGNTVEKNIGRNSRYSLHFMYADRNKVLDNDFQDNSVGIFLMFSQGSTLKNNLLANATGPFGIGIGMKEASDILVEDNNILYNARGFYIDASPYVPGTVNTFKDNRIEFNSVAFHLHGTLYGSIFEDNVIKGNIDDVVNDTPESKIALNRWNRNYWDNYQGFDRDKDGIGDIPFEQRMFADRLWQHKHPVKIFYASPVLELLNMLWKIMPFSEPELVAKDNEPRVLLPGGQTP